MPNHETRERVDALAATATFLPDVDHSDYEGYPVKRARETSPYRKGNIILAQLGRTGKDAPKRVLVYALDLSYSDRFVEWVDHVSGFIERKDGSFGTTLRRITRGDITRGYADKLLRPDLDPRFCPTCEADLDGNDPHASDCPQSSVA